MYFTRSIIKKLRGIVSFGRFIWKLEKKAILLGSNKTTQDRDMDKTKDPMGAAIAEYHKTGKASRLRVFSPDFDEDEIPVDLLFRSFDEMPEMEQKALQMAGGRILDVGAGAGCHSLALQEMQKVVTAVEISPLSVETMRERGVAQVLEQDFFTLTERYDTILMLMNGIGIVGKVERLPAFFRHIDHILADGGQVLLDSSDICYLFEDEYGIIVLPEDGKYYGELEYQMRYRNVKGEPFPWLYLDFETLQRVALENGFCAELMIKGEHYDYLARITRKR